MSSLDSQFLCLGTIFTEDIVRPVRPNIGDRAVVRFARLFVIVVVALTFVLSLVLPRSVFELGVWSFTGFTGLFPIVVAALYWRRVTAPGAIAAVLATATIWIVLFTRSGFGKNKGYTFPESAVDLGLLEIPIMHPIATVTLVSAIVLIVVSLVTKAPSNDVVDRFFLKGK